MYLVRKNMQTYNYEIFVKWRRETSTVSWIITLLSENCWKFSLKQMRIHIYNFCSPVCYHCSCQSHKMHSVSPAMSYLWPTCGAVFDFVLFRIPVIYKADSLQLPQSGHFYILAVLWESYLFTGRTCHHHQIFIFLYFQSITGNNRVEYLIIWNRP